MDHNWNSLECPMRHKICKSFLRVSSMVLITIFGFNTCDELEPDNPADPAYTLKAPTLISVQAITDIQIDLTWQNNEEHTQEFVVQRKSGSVSYSAIGTVDKDILTFTDTACVLGLEYSYVVQSRVDSNVSANSNTISKATTFPGPDNLSVISISIEAVLLTWTDNCSFEVGYRIERDAGSEYSEIGTVPADVLDYTDSGLTFGQSYDYRVAAYNADNTSSWATITATVEFSAPSDLSASSVSDSELRLNWIDNTGYESGFRIERDSGSGFTEIGTVSSDVTEYTDSGLTFAQNYDYRILAFTSAINSDYSATVTATSCMSCVVDIDGNVYETIQIGTQVWMVENLKVTHYRDNTAITKVTGKAEWGALTTEAYCIYSDNASNEVETYGALYNWYAVNDNRNVAPLGWHVPTDVEWTELETYLSNNGHSGAEGAALKSTAGWDSGNGTDDYGFTALPGGYRNYDDGYSRSMGNYGYFWSATEYVSGTAWGRRLDYNRSGVDRFNYGKNYGFAIRCLRD
jgi:uncharacterized protein (TIGR02145 family)